MISLLRTTSLVALALTLSLPVLVQAKKLDKVKLALNWKAEPEFGGFYAAQINGEFKKRGLEVEILEGGSGAPTVQMLAHQKVDFAIVSADEILISQDRNPKDKVKGFFAVYQTAPYVIMTHEARGFKSLREVFTSSGTISLQSGLPYYQFLTKRFGKPKANIVPYSGGVAAFLNNPKLSQQGFITSEPLAAEKAGGKVKNFLIADEGFNPYLVVVAVHEQLLQKNPDLVRRMHDAVKAGWESYLHDSTATNKVMSELNKSMDFDTFQKAADVQKPLIDNTITAKNGLGSMSEERWVLLSEQLYSLKLIKAKANAFDLYQNMNNDQKPSVEPVKTK